MAKKILSTYKCSWEIRKEFLTIDKKWSTNDKDSFRKDSRNLLKKESARMTELETSKENYMSCNPKSRSSQWMTKNVFLKKNKKWL